jgi:hypothetical protein
MNDDKEYQHKAKWGDPINTSTERGQEELNDLFFQIGKDLTSKIAKITKGEMIEIKWTNYTHREKNPDNSIGQFRIITTREKPQP